MHQEGDVLMIAFSIWEMTLIVTLVFAGFSHILQTIMKRGQKDETMSFATLLDQNKLLVTQLDDLQKQIVTLNRELSLLTEENKALNNEVSSLTKEVSRLQIQVNNIK